jgi:hypothetical protein
MKTFILLVLFILYLNTGFTQPIPTDSLYLAQTPPDYTPKVFSLPVNGTMRPVERITITSDGKEIYFCEIQGYPANVQRIKCYKYLNNKWQGPFVVFEGFMDPALSMNDSIIYMETNVNTFATSYYSVRNSTGWSTPVRCVSTNQQTHYFQETNPKNYYMSATFPGLSSKDLAYLQINGTDTTIKNLGKPINTNMDENDFFIAPDESYIMHARSSSSVAGDLYISYKKTNGSWTNSKSLGPQVNMSGSIWEFGCYVTKDNKYLFFTRGGNSWPSYYVYWVRIDNLIDSLKHTNFIPYLKNQIPNQTDTVGQVLNYTFPDSTFVDDDGNNTLTYSATLSSGAALPSWISFNPSTRAFTFNPTATGSTGLKVTATDTANASVTCTFTLNVVDHTFIHESNGQIINEFKLFQNFPNPFNPSTVISYSLSNNSNVSLKLYNVLGKEIVTLVDSFQKTGVYDVNLDMNKLNLSSGVYFYTLNASEQSSGKVFKITKMMNFVK